MLNNENKIKNQTFGGYLVHKSLKCLPDQTSSKIIIKK